MDIELGTVSSVIYDEVEGAPNNSPQQFNKLHEEHKRDSIISIRNEDQPGSVLIPRSNPKNVVVRIVECLKHFCCCCFRHPQQNPLNVLDEKGTTPVFRALKKCDLEKVYKLIEQGSNLRLSKEQSTGRSFFHLATHIPELVEYLIKNGKMDDIDINTILDNNGSTPIGYAFLKSQMVPSEEGSTELISSATALLNWQGRFDQLILTRENCKIRTVLHYVIEKEIEITFKGPRNDLNSITEVEMSPLCYALYIAWEKSNRNENTDIYLNNARRLFQANAQIIYTNQGIPPDYQQSFCQFVKKNGFGDALTIDQAANEGNEGE